MIQSRAQFGVFGAVLPLILVVLMYLGYFASGNLLGGQALSAITSLPVDLSILLYAGLSALFVYLSLRLVTTHMTSGPCWRTPNWTCRRFCSRFR